MSAVGECPICGGNLLQKIAAALVPPPALGTDCAFNSDLTNLDADALRLERGRLRLHRLLIERPSPWHQDRLQKVEDLLDRRGVRR